MTPDDIEQIVQAIGGNTGMIYIIISCGIAISPKIYSLIKKRLTKQLDEKVVAISEEIIKPITELTKMIKSQHETSLEAQKMFMEEIAEIYNRLDNHDNRLKKIEIKTKKSGPIG